MIGSSRRASRLAVSALHQVSVMASCPAERDLGALALPLCVSNMVLPKDMKAVPIFDVAVELEGGQVEGRCTTLWRVHGCDMTFGQSTIQTTSETG